MGGAKNCPETPRQKMIGMMYLVLTAMLALNVSTDILNGFTMVDESLHNSIETSHDRNDALYEDMEYLYGQNSVKVQEWWDKTNTVKAKSDSMFKYLQEVKIDIIKLADGNEADPEGRVVIKKDNLDVAGQYVGLSTGMANGKKLKAAIEDYRYFIEDMYGNDSAKTKIIELLFNTESKKNTQGDNVDWINSRFESMPVIAVITMLSKYQSDVRATEAEVIQYFRAQTDAGDFRVNKIEAILIPESKHVMQGGSYQATLALVAVDTTKSPTYYLGERKLDTNILRIPGGSIGTFPIKGRIEVVTPDGITVPYYYESEYTVGAPTATIANQDMNVVYRGYDNRMEISVPGVPSEKLRVSANGATMQKEGNVYICKPSKDGEITINVAAEIEGKLQTMGTSTFRVRPLPDPQAFLRFRDANGNMVDYRPGGKIRLRRTDLVNSTMVAEYEDGMLKASFRITEFTLMIADGRGGYTTTLSDGNKFSESQQTQLQRLKSGSIIFFDKIKVTGAKNTVLNYPQIALP
jgi:gliding motility-associated protein GldM